jgi:hypothetical protein
MSNLVVLNVELDPQAADPAAPPDGLLWYRSDISQYRIRRGGSTYNVVDSQALQDAIDAAIQGLAWQDPVIAEQASPPVGPTAGDRYIVTAVATGAWAGQEDNIAEWDGAAWVFTVPVEGFVARNNTTDAFRLYDGTGWGAFEVNLDHGSLLGLGDDDHVQYLLVNGTRAMSGDLDMGTNDITNVGLVDGVDVSAHAARHIQGGADEIDGDQLDVDFTPTNYTPTTTGVAPDVDMLGAHLNGIDLALASVGAEDEKAGTVLNASFAGNPKSATVTFTTPYPNANYSVRATVINTGGGKEYLTNIHTKTANGFTIVIAANNISQVTAVDWNTKPYLDP